MIVKLFRFEYRQKEDVDSLLRLRSPGIAKHLTHLYEQKPMPTGVSIRGLSSCVFFNLAN